MAYSSGVESGDKASPVMSHVEAAGYDGGYNEKTGGEPPVLVEEEHTNLTFGKSMAILVIIFVIPTTRSATNACSPSWWDISLTFWSARWWERH